MADLVQHPLEPDRDTRARLLDRFAKFAQDQLDLIERVPAGAMPTDLAMARAQTLEHTLGEAPSDGGIEQILATLESALETSLPTPGAGYLAYIPGGGIYAAALADFVADCLNRYTGLAMAAPGLCRLEADVLRWLATQFGYGTDARGLLTTGGSLANLSAVVAARVDRLDPDADLRCAVAYTSSQAHHSVARSIHLAGIPGKNLRALPTDARYRLDPEALCAAIDADRRAGMRPFLVVAAAGSTNTGAIDPLGELAEICHERGLWLHVDGAYGGAFALCGEGARRLAGIERADSITFDPHKGMFLPYGTGCLLVRDGQKLRRAHQHDADYLQDFGADLAEELVPSPTEYGPELSRDFRGLRLWLPLALHGAAPFRAALAEKLELAEYFCEQLVRHHGDRVEIVDPPQLSVVAFRVRRRSGEALSDWDGRNRALMQGINGRSRVFLSSTRLAVADGMAFTNRVCVLSFRTHRAQIDDALEDLAHSLREID